jgi:hypothetical protein
MPGRRNARPGRLAAAPDGVPVGPLVPARLTCGMSNVTLRICPQDAV